MEELLRFIHAADNDAEHHKLPDENAAQHEEKSMNTSSFLVSSFKGNGYAGIYLTLIR